MVLQCLLSKENRIFHCYLCDVRLGLFVENHFGSERGANWSYILETFLDGPTAENILQNIPLKYNS